MHNLGGSWNLDVVLDVGCGIMPEHGTTKDSIGVDINFEHGKVYVDTPIIADAHNLPIRDSVVDVFYAKAILEHLEKPSKCMKDISRTLRETAYGIILIPCDADTRREVFRRFVKEFPFATIYTLKKMWKWRKYYKIDGLMHKTQIDLSDVQQYFNVDTNGIIWHKRLNQWFVHKTPLVLLIKLGMLKTRLFVNEMAEIEFMVTRK